MSQSTADQPLTARFTLKDLVGFVVGLVIFGWGLNIYVETLRREIRAEFRQMLTDERERNAVLYQPRNAGASKP